MLSDTKTWGMGSLQREGFPYTAEEERHFYGKGELRAFTRPPHPVVPEKPPPDPNG
jgi:hypothetical protein